MQTNTLKRIHPNRKRMIVARGGHRGKTAGRGGKGQSARAGNKRRPEWRDIIKRLPKLRGRGVNSNKSFSAGFFPVNVSMIEEFYKTGESVTPTTLIEKGAVSTQSGVIPAIKILGDGEITKAVKVSGCAISGSAKEKIEKAGGSVVVLIAKVVVKNSTPAVVSAEVKAVQEKNKGGVKDVEKKVEKKAEPKIKAEKKEKVKTEKADKVETKSEKKPVSKAKKA